MWTVVSGSVIMAHAVLLPDGGLRMDITAVNHDVASPFFSLSNNLPEKNEHSDQHKHDKNNLK